MGSAEPGRGLALYRKLLRLLPREFVEGCEAEILETVEAMVRRLGRGSILARIRFWTGAYADLAGRIVAEWWRVLRGPAVRDAGLETETSGGMTMMFGNVLADLRFAFRSTRRRPFFAIAAVLTLALGIGVNTTIFSVVDTLLFRPLPYPEYEELVGIWNANVERGWNHTDVSLADSWDYYHRTSGFEGILAYDRRTATLTGGDRPERISGHGVNWDGLPVLGIDPALGRHFTREDATPGAPRVAILGHGLWERSFGSDPAILGTDLVMEGETVTIVGVMPAGYVFPQTIPDFWVPIQGDLRDQRRDNFGNLAVARMKPGVELAMVQDELAELSLRLAEEYPEARAGWRSYAEPVRDGAIRAEGQQIAKVLMAAVFLVLLLACANVANLLLAQAGGRRSEAAVRAALGASRGRVVAQLLTESLLLAIMGGVIGLICARWGVDAIVSALPSDLPMIFQFSTDWRTATFALAATVGATLLFGLLPALRVTDLDGTELRDGGRGGPSRKTLRTGGVLVVVQSALAMTLLVAGGVMVKSVAGMYAKDLGMDPDGVLTFRVGASESRYPEAEDLAVFYEELLESVARVPGVTQVSTVLRVPLSGSNTIVTVARGDAADPDGADGFAGRLNYVGPEYFQTMGATLVSGAPIVAGTENEFGEGDPVPAVVNRTLVERIMADGQDPVGALLALNGDRPLRVIGVVEDIVERGLESPAESAVYLPMNAYTVRNKVVVARLESDLGATLPAIQRAVWSVDPTVPLYQVSPMEDYIASRVSPFRLMARLLGGFALISLVLGGIGIYGVTAHSVGQRRHEIGVRVALGAGRSDVTSMVVRSGLRRVVIGMAFGSLLALGLAQAMAGVLVGVSPRDPVTYGIVVVLLLGVGILGCYLPARKAASISPVEALGEV
jgi:putative ABC transport system permease protein